MSVRAEDLAGNWSSPVIVQLTVRPPAPSGLSAASPAAVPVLTWGAVPDATSYNVYRDGVSVGTTSATSYTDTTALPGPHSYQVTAVASGTESDPSNTVTVLVGPIAPAVTWPSPSAVTYGTALGPAQLDASASVPGTFSYSPAAGTVLGAGTQTLSVTFTPADPTDYTPVTTTTTLTVNPATVTVTASSLSKVAGLANPPLTYTLSGLVNGDTASVISGNPVLATTATTSSPAGAYPITVDTSGMSAANYTFAGVNGTLTVGLPVASVNVVSSTGAPLPGVPVTVQAAGGAKTSLTTGTDGSATASLAAGTYTVTATYATGTESQQLTVTAAGPNTVTFTTVAVTVQINDPSAADIAAAAVAHAGNTGTFGPKTAVNPAGQVVFQALPGTSSFTAYVAGGYQTQTLTASAAGPNTVTFTTVAVTVTVDKGGAPLPTATVSHAGNTGTYGPKTAVNSAGQVVFQALPGTSYFSAWDGSAYTTQTLTVTGTTSTTITVT